MITSILNHRSPFVRQYTIVLLLNLHCVCAGMSLAWPSPMLVKLKNGDVLATQITDDQGSWIVSLPYLTLTIMTLFAGVLVDRLGRKWCLVMTFVPKILLCLLLVFANKLWMILLARALDGLTLGLTFSLLPLYASEIANKNLRGPLGTLFQICTCLGSVVMLAVGPFLSYTSINGVFLAIAIITSMPMSFMPETPSYLHAKGKHDEAVKIMTFLRGSETLARQELAEYTAPVKEKIDIRSLISNNVFLKAFAICLVLSIGIQIIGGSLVTVYLQTILETANTTVKPEISSLIVGFIQLGASIFAQYLTGRIGRRPLLISTLILMNLGMLGLGTFFQIQSTGHISGFLNYLPLISFIFVIFGFSCGPGSVFWLILPEMYDGPTRAVGLSINLFFSHVVLYLSMQYFSRFTAAIGAANTFWCFSVVCFLYNMFIVVFLPETKGKSFAEIQKMIKGNDK